MYETDHHRLIAGMDQKLLRNLTTSEGQVIAASDKGSHPSPKRMNFWTSSNPPNHKWPNMAKMAIYGHLATRPYATNMVKWGIPEENYKNVAQQC